MPPDSREWKKSLIDLGSLGVMADEDQFDVFVGTCQEQVEQHEKTFGDLLAFLIHRAGNVHQTEHHGLR